MGINCITRGKSHLFPSLDYEEFTMTDFTSSQCIPYSSESELNEIKDYLFLFSELPLHDFIEELHNNYSSELRLSFDHFKDEITIDEIASLIQDQIIIIKEVATKMIHLAKEKKIKVSKIKSNLIKIIKIIFTTVHEYFKNDQDDQLMIMRKAYLLYFGMLFCKSTNIEKAILFFELFSTYQDDNSNGLSSSCMSSQYVLKTNYYIDTFVKMICFFCGPAIGACIKTKEKQYQEISELRSCQLSSRLFNKQMFGDNNRDIVNLDKCISLFQSNGLGWVFNPSSVRTLLSTFINDIDINVLLKK